MVVRRRGCTHESEGVSVGALDIQGPRKTCASYTEPTVRKSPEPCLACLFAPTGDTLAETLPSFCSLQDPA